MLFSVYTIGLSHLLKNHGIKFKLFADDTQFYFSLNNISDVEEKLNTIMLDVNSWMGMKQLKLNNDKTECLIVGKKNDIIRFGQVSQLSIQGNGISINDCVKDLGVMLDSNLTFDTQINKVVRNAGYHLRNISFIRKYLDESTTRLLIHNYVINGLDYCNSLYYGLPSYQLRKLQNVMNWAARLIRGVSR